MPAKTKYLNAHRRELVLWCNSLQLILQSNIDRFKGKELKWINSIVLSVEALSKLMLDGVDSTELRAIDNAIKVVEPTLYAHKLVNSQEPAVKVNIDLLYDLAESAVQLCKYECDGNFDTCPRRKMFLDLLIPAWSESGPCQFYRKE